MRWRSFQKHAGALGLPVLRQSIQRRAAQRFQDQVSTEQSVLRRPESRRALARHINIVQNCCNSKQGSVGMSKSNICHQGTVGLFSLAVPSRASLTVRIWTPPQTQETDRLNGPEGSACSRISGIWVGPV